jgi:hypothetical protein
MQAAVTQITEARHIQQVVAVALVASGEAPLHLLRLERVDRASTATSRSQIPKSVIAAAVAVVLLPRPRGSVLLRMVVGTVPAAM